MDSKSRWVGINFAHKMFKSKKTVVTDADALEVMTVIAGLKLYDRWEAEHMGTVLSRQMIAN